jgi:hypothetical protein
MPVIFNKGVRYTGKYGKLKRRFLNTVEFQNILKQPYLMQA